MGNVPRRAQERQEGRLVRRPRAHRHHRRLRLRADLSRHRSHPALPQPQPRGPLHRRRAQIRPADHVRHRRGPARHDAARPVRPGVRRLRLLLRPLRLLPHRLPQHGKDSESPDLRFRHPVPPRRPRHRVPRQPAEAFHHLHGRAHRHQVQHGKVQGSHEEVQPHLYRTGRGGRSAQAQALSAARPYAGAQRHLERHELLRRHGRPA